MSFPPLSVSTFIHAFSALQSRRILSATVAVVFLSVTFTTLLSAAAEYTSAVYTQCSDGIDNNADGRTDYPQDPQCLSIDDDYEGSSGVGTFITITDDKDQVRPGGAVTYAITLKQQRENVRNVNIKLHVPVQVTLYSATDGGSIRPGEVTWTNVSVYKNNTRTITVNANINPDAPIGQYLVARVSTEGAEATDTTIVAEYVPPQTDKMSLSISDGKDFVLPGDTVTYTVNAQFNGDQPMTNDIRLVLPYETQFVSASDSGRHQSYTVTWPNQRFAPGEKRTYTVTATIDPRTPDRRLLTTKAYVGSVNVFDKTSTRIGIPDGAISARITDNRSTARANDLLTYTVTVFNDSDILGTNVSIDAALPRFAEFVSATEGGYWDGGNVRWLIMQIAPNGTRTLQYTIRVRADAPEGSLLTASVAADGFVSRDTTDVASYVAQTNDRVLFRKTADRGEAFPGGRIRYTLLVRNTLDHAITNAEIDDRYNSAYLSVASIEDRSGLISESAGSMTWRVPVLQPGETWQVSYVLLVGGRIPAGTDLDNVATLRGGDLSGVALTERVRTTVADVMHDTPATGASMDAILAMLLGLPALGTALAQRKIFG